MRLQVVLNSDALEFGGLCRIDEKVGWARLLPVTSPVRHASQVEHFTSPEPFNNR